MADISRKLLRLLISILELVGIALYRAGAAPWIIRARPGAVRVFLYHSCMQEEDDFVRGLASNVTPARFAEQMEFVVRHYSVLPIAALDGRPLPVGAAAVTFDDGYRSVLTQAAPILRAFRIPFTVYVVTDVVGNGALIWVNELNWMLWRHPECVRPVVAEALAVRADEAPGTLIDLARERLSPEQITSLLIKARSRAAIDPIRLAAEARPYLSWSELRQLVADGNSIGNHTAAHPSLAALDSASARAEIARAHSAICEVIGHCESFAYPFGDVSVEARAAAMSSGYASIMEVGGAQWPLRPNRVARVSAPDASAARLFAQAEIVEPLKAWVRARTPGGTTPEA